MTNDFKNINDSRVLQPVPRRKSSEIDGLIGRRVRLRRTLLGLTQADLAQRCFLSSQQIHKYEMGSSALSAARLDQFARALDVPIAWFFEEMPFDAKLPNDLVELLSDASAMRILKLFKEIGDPATKALIVTLAEEVATYRHAQPSAANTLDFPVKRKA